LKEKLLNNFLEEDTVKYSEMDRCN
jgi:hypothetical protein